MVLPSLRVPVALALEGKGARATLQRRRTPSAPEDSMRMMPAAATVGTDLKAGVCCFLRESVVGELQGREHAIKVLHLCCGREGSKHHAGENDGRGAAGSMLRDAQARG